jgi:hypothetical protein
MNLRERKVRMLEMDFLRTPPVGDPVQRHLDDLGIDIIDPGHTAVIKPNMGGR